MLELIKSQLESENIQFEGKKFLLGVSGGVDSMVLLDVFRQLSLNVEVAHINYKLRAEDADLDAQCVKAYCDKANIALHLKTVSDSAKLKTGNLQANARAIRFTFFSELTASRGFDYIVLANHRDDQIENILINLFRGIGPKTMRSQDDLILRPFLKLSKSDLGTYARLNNISYREDQSNKANDYTRNYLRNEIIPSLKQNFEHLDVKLLAFAERHWKDQQLLGSLSKATRNINDLKSANHLYHCCKDYGFKYAQCTDFFKNGLTNGSKLISSSHIVLIYNDLLRFYSINHSTPIKALTVQLKDLPSSIGLRKGRLRIQEATSALETRPLKESVLINPESISFPLRVRSWNAGDKIQLKGMNGKHKKLKKLFKENKLDEIQRINTVIVLDSTERIICIPSLKICDPSFSAKAKQEKIIEIYIQN